MIDIILITFVVAVYAGGFWCGAKYKSPSAMWEDIKKSL